MKRMMLLLLLLPVTAAANPDGPPGSGWVEPQFSFSREVYDDDMWPAVYYEARKLTKVTSLGGQFGVVVSEQLTLTVGAKLRLHDYEVDVETGASDGLDWTSFRVDLGLRLYWGTD